MCTCPELRVPAGQEGLLLQTQGPGDCKGVNLCCQIINIYFCWKRYTYLILYSDFVFVMLTIVCDSSQIVSGKGFEVPRRVYVDFNGINLRRKFLTGLEPESINMTIGKIILMFHVFDSCNGIDSD